ncbi:hypothetical protein EET67_05545 [Pseudaminobacter arsenicus]|uniref:Uncharacterized protein n=1 Tax=Borborobacter arsenicus TaxID=1851146 RepID=A0A432VAF4_9HYPH|nr:hypothetical protein [Pseudaminobacter arsenicus]RUM99096.1 hypothetical protein EET67_05545 [Pseudaminobacter arsenicus]
MPGLSAGAKYLFISLLRAASIFGLFVGSLAVAYMIGSILVGIGMIPCSDAKSCAMVPAFMFMPLGGLALYFLSLVTWSLLVRQRKNDT